MTDNELIAEFMGLTIKDGWILQSLDSEEIEISNLKYQTSRDALWPVIRKICDMYEQWPKEVNTVRTFGIGSDHHKVYKAVVQFIHWYNSAALATLKRSRWIPVSERLPELNQWTLVFDNTVSCIIEGEEMNRPRIGCFKGDAGRGNEWIMENWSLNPDVTHWMPLPEPPEK